jgi:hypothetical protein
MMEGGGGDFEKWACDLADDSLDAKTHRNRNIHPTNI